MLAPSIIFFPLPVSEYLADFNDLFMALDLLRLQLLGENVISLVTPNTLNTPFIGFCTMKLPYKGKLSNSVCMAPVDEWNFPVQVMVYAGPESRPVAKGTYLVTARVILTPNVRACALHQRHECISYSTKTRTNRLHSNPNVY